MWERTGKKVCVPPAHTSHDSCPSASETVPGAHTEHSALWPGGGAVPLRHSSGATVRTVGHTCPAGQGAQLREASVAANVPGWQSTHDEAPAVGMFVALPAGHATAVLALLAGTWPAGAVLQVSCIASGWNCPAGQSWQPVAPSRTMVWVPGPHACGNVDPSGHPCPDQQGLHSVLSGRELNEPAGQREHDSELAAAEKLPGAQGTQEPATSPSHPIRANPGAQLTQSWHCAVTRSKKLPSSQSRHSYVELIMYGASHSQSSGESDPGRELDRSGHACGAVDISGQKESAGHSSGVKDVSPFGRYLPATAPHPPSDVVPLPAVVMRFGHAEQTALPTAAYSATPHSCTANNPGHAEPAGHSVHCAWNSWSAKVPGPQAVHSVLPGSAVCPREHSE